MSRRGAGDEPDRGSAAVDFVLVGSLVTLMFLGLVQLAVDYHVRNVLAACAADGARYASNADVTDPAAGAAQADDEVTRALGPSYARATSPDREDSVDGAPVATVSITARLPLLAWFLPHGPTVHVTGHALMEPR